MQNIKHQPLYVSLQSGELTCYSCAGYALRSSISNAKAGTERFTGINGEPFVLTFAQESAQDCEYC